MCDREEGENTQKKRREKRNIYINIYVYITHRKERREKKY
jgi:hypothetical protein